MLTATVVTGQTGSNVGTSEHFSSLLFTTLGSAKPGTALDHPYSLLGGRTSEPDVVDAHPSPDNGSPQLLRLPSGLGERMEGAAVKTEFTPGASLLASSTFKAREAHQEGEGGAWHA